MKISVVNGPNINLLGIREVEYYGHESLDSILTQLMDSAKTIGVDIEHFQSNHEGQIVDYIQSKLEIADGFIINPAGLTKTGYCILDALNTIKKPFIEVHLSNVFSRGEKHIGSIFSDDAVGVICGFKGYSYSLALFALHDMLKNKSI